MYAFPPTTGPANKHTLLQEGRALAVKKKGFENTGLQKGAKGEFAAICRSLENRKRVAWFS